MIVLRKPYRPSLETNVVVADVLAGAIDGSNYVYRTTYKYKRDRITVYYNGQALHSPYDFDQTGDTEITFKYTVPLSDEKVRATYELEGVGYGNIVRGQQVVAIGSISQDIHFGVSLPNFYYSTDVELTTTDGAPSVYSYVIGSKTVNGFTVFFSGVIDTANYVIDWAISP
jgi:hypothetical protein